MLLRIGFVGTGNFAKMHAQLLSGMKDVSINAFCGTSMDKAEKLAKEYPDAKAFADIVEMLDDGALDAVYICVPPSGHGNIERTLINRGIPFFIEKPLGIGDEPALELSQKIQKGGLVTSVGYHFRYMESVQRARMMLSTCDVGMASGYWLGRLSRSTWGRRRALSGGQFNEQTTHVTDLIRYLLGEVDELYAAFAQNVVGKLDDQTDVYDVGAITMKMASGIIVSITNTYVLPDNYRSGLQIYTNKGVLELDQSSLKDVTADRVTEYKNRTNAYIAENEAFLHALRTGDGSGILSTYEDSCKTQQIAAAALRSAESGKPVKLK